MSAPSIPTQLLKTAALDARVPLRDVQGAASHADPRTTMRYDRARVSLDRHATYLVSTFIAGASRVQSSGRRHNPTAPTALCPRSPSTRSGATPGVLERCSVRFRALG